MSDLIPREPVALPAVPEPRSQNIWIDQYLDDKQSELSRYGRILYKRRVLIIAITLLVFSAGAAWTWTRPRFYTSSVNLQIEPESNLLPFKKEIVGVINPDPTYLRTQAQVIKSESVARRIVERLGLAKSPEEAERLAVWFAGSVAVTNVEGTQVLKVSFQSEDPVFAAQAVNVLAEGYVDFGFEQNRRSTAPGRDYIQSELTEVGEKLRKSELRLVEYGRLNKI